MSKIDDSGAARNFGGAPEVNLRREIWINPIADEGNLQVGSTGKAVLPVEQHEGDAAFDMDRGEGYDR